MSMCTSWSKCLKLWKIKIFKQVKRKLGEKNHNSSITWEGEYLNNDFIDYLKENEI